MRKDEAYLQDMADAASRIARYLGGVTREAFMADEKTQAAVVRRELGLP